MSQQGSSHDEYEFIEKIGDGSFGQVYKAKHKITHQVVAVKTVKHKYSKSLEDTSDYKLREYRALRSLEWHPNIVQLHKSFVASPDELHLVMEYVNGGNLYDFINERRSLQKPIEHCEVRRMLRQLLEALAHIHRHGIFHRDLKPENILISRPDFLGGTPIIKLGDFGLARSVDSKGPYTEYVSTRWYRAPEVLLRCKSYSYPVDLWAVGAIFAELITANPLFPGNSEIDQLYRICSVLGTPGTTKLFSRKTSLKHERRSSPGFARKAAAAAEQHTPVAGDPDNEWKEGVKLAQRIGFMFPQLAPKPLATVVPNASASMLDLLRQFLYYDPVRRIEAEKALLHPFIVDEPVCHKHGARLRHDSLNRDGKKPRTNYNSGVGGSDKDIVAVDLLAAPVAPLQICPVWDYDRPGYLQPVNATAQLATTSKKEDDIVFQQGSNAAKVDAHDIPNNNNNSDNDKDSILPTTSTFTSTQFNLDTIAHYGKQLTTWQLPSDALQRSYKTSVDINKDKRHSKDIRQTLKYHYKDWSRRAERPHDELARAHVPSSIALDEETSGEYNTRLNSWPWLKVL